MFESIDKSTKEYFRDFILKIRLSNLQRCFQNLFQINQIILFLVAWIVKHKHEAQQGLSRGGMKCLAAFDPAGFRILLTSFKVVLFSQRRTNNAEPRLSSSAHYLLLYRRVERRLKVRGDGPVFFAFSCQSRKVLILQDRYCLSNTRVT